MDFSSLHLSLFSSLSLGKASKLSKSQLSLRDTSLNTLIHIISSDSKLEIEDISFDLAPKLLFPTS